MHNLVNDTRIALISAGLSFGIFCAPLKAAEPPSTPPPPKPWSPSIPDAPSDEVKGFTSIFDGKSLNHWKGDPQHWRVENGKIIGEATPANPLKAHSYLVWQGGRLGDFEIRLEYRINSTGNSGFIYRANQDPNYKWGLRGYQFDIDGAGWGRSLQEGKAKEMGWSLSRSTGSNYSEDKAGERTWIALPGQMTYAETGRHPRVVASVESAKELTGAINEEGWNKLRVIVRGNLLVHILNGRTMSIVMDDDAANRRLDGLIAVQVHRGPPLKVEFRNILLKKFSK